MLRRLSPRRPVMWKRRLVDMSLDRRLSVRLTALPDMLQRLGHHRRCPRSGECPLLREPTNAKAGLPDLFSETGRQLGLLERGTNALSGTEQGRRILCVVPVGVLALRLSALLMTLLNWRSTLVWSHLFHSAIS